MASFNQAGDDTQAVLPAASKELPSSGLQNEGSIMDFLLSGSRIKAPELEPVQAQVETQPQPTRAPERSVFNGAPTPVFERKVIDQQAGLNQIRQAIGEIAIAGQTLALAETTPPSVEPVLMPGAISIEEVMPENEKSPLAIFLGRKKKQQLRRAA